MAKDDLARTEQEQQDEDDVDFVVDAGRQLGGPLAGCASAGMFAALLLAPFGLLVL